MAIILGADVSERTTHKKISMCIYCYKNRGAFPRQACEWPQSRPRRPPILDQITAGETLFLIERVIHVSRVQNVRPANNQLAVALQVCG